MMPSDNEPTIKDNLSMVELENAPFHDQEPQLEGSLWREVLAFRALIPHVFGIYVLVIAIGIDTGMSGLTLGIASFRHQFGYYLNDQSGWVIEAKYQSAWSGASTGAQVFGAMISGYLADRLGRLLPLRLAALIVIIGTVMVISARQVGLLIAGKAVIGIGIGFLVAQAAPYLSEIAPTRIRGMVIASINVSLVVGQWLSTALIWICTSVYPSVDDNRSWLILFGLQFVFPATFLVWSFWLVESPVYLIQVGKPDLAKAAARKLYGANFDSDAHVGRISREAEIENRNQSGSISFWEAGKGPNLRRTMIGILVVVGQILAGNLFVLSYQNYFYELAGISGSQALTFGNYTVSLFANLCSYLVIDTLGRRPLYTTGVFILGISNFIVGFMSLVENSNPTAAGAVAVFGMYLWSFTYQLTVGPVGWAVVGEVPSNRLRAKTNSWINMFNSLFGFGIGYAIPYLFNPDAANLGLKMGYIFGALSAVLFLLSYFFLPETMGRTAQDLDEMFEKKISARKFSDTRFDRERAEA